MPKGYTDNHKIEETLRKYWQTPPERGGNWIKGATLPLIGKPTYVPYHYLKDPVTQLAVISDGTLDSAPKYSSKNRDYEITLTELVMPKGLPVLDPLPYYELEEWQVAANALQWPQVAPGIWPEGNWPVWECDFDEETQQFSVKTYRDGDSFKLKPLLVATNGSWNVMVHLMGEQTLTDFRKVMVQTIPAIFRGLWMAHMSPCVQILESQSDVFSTVSPFKKMEESVDALKTKVAEVSSESQLKPAANNPSTPPPKSLQNREPDATVPIVWPGAAKGHETTAEIYSWEANNVGGILKDYGACVVIRAKAQADKKQSGKKSAARKSKNEGKEVTRASLLGCNHLISVAKLGALWRASSMHPYKINNRDEFSFLWMSKKEKFSWYQSYFGTLPQFYVRNMVASHLHDLEYLDECITHVFPEFQGPTARRGILEHFAANILPKAEFAYPVCRGSLISSLGQKEEWSFKLQEKLHAENSVVDTNNGRNNCLGNTMIPGESVPSPPTRMCPSHPRCLHIKAMEQAAFSVTPRLEVPYIPEDERLLITSEARRTSENAGERTRQINRDREWKRKQNKKG